jgi:hypothetical protein
MYSTASFPRGNIYIGKFVPLFPRGISRCQSWRLSIFWSENDIPPHLENDSFPPLTTC